MEALKIGLTAEELAKFVQQRGVDFAVTAPVETELRGAGAKPELIEAVRANFRQAGAAPAAPAAPKATPLGKGDILTLLQVGTPSPRIETLVAQRGLSFAVTPDIAAELQAAGATPALLTALGYRPAAPAPGQACPGEVKRGATAARQQQPPPEGGRRQVNYREARPGRNSSASAATPQQSPSGTGRQADSRMYAM